MHGNRRMHRARISTRLIMARKKPRQSSSPRRGNWRADLDPDIMIGRALQSDDELAEDSPENGEPSDD